MSIVSGTIRKDSTDVAYMTTAPAEGILHIAYQTVNRDDIGTTYHTLYAENERHLVNGINSLYNTSFTWGDMEDETLAFFNPAGGMTKPIVCLKFQKVGEYYIAVVEENTSEGTPTAHPVSEIGDIMTTLETAPGELTYYAAGDDVDILRRFLNTNYTTNKVSLRPSRGIDSTQILFDVSEGMSTLIPVVVRNFKNDGGFTTITLINRPNIVNDLNIDEFTTARALKAINSDGGFQITEDNMVGPDIVRVFNPFVGVDMALRFQAVKKGDKTRYLAVALEPLPVPPDTDPDNNPPQM